MRLAAGSARFALAACITATAWHGGAAQAGGGSSAAKKTAPSVTTSPTTQTPPPAGAPGKPEAKVMGSFGSWTLLCGEEEENGKARERCSLVMPLVESKSQKLMFRVILTYGPQGQLVLRVDGPTGIALQRGVEFLPDVKDAKKVYRMPFQTCLPMGCKALLIVPDDLKKALLASAEGAITVYALNGKAVQTVTEFSGFDQALAALNKHVGVN